MTTQHPDRSDPEVRDARAQVRTFVPIGLAILGLVAAVIALHLAGVIGG